MRRLSLGTPPDDPAALMEWIKGALAEIEHASHDADDTTGSSTTTTSTTGSAPNAGVRLSLDSTAAVTTTDQSGAGTVYVHPIEHNNIAPYDTTSAEFVVRTFSISAITLTAGAHPANSNYSIFAAWDSTNSVMFFGTGPVWTGANTVGTGSGTSETEAYRGRLVNKNAITLTNGSTTLTVAVREALHLGGFRTVLAAQTDDANEARLLHNVYNKNPRPVRRVEFTDSWAGTATNAWRQANNTTSNRIRTFSSTGADPVSLKAYLLATNSTTTARSTGTAIGLDSTTLPAVNSMKFVQAVSDQGRVLVATYDDIPTIGYHEFNWLELSGTSEARTFYGDNADSTFNLSGMFGQVIA